MSVERRRYPRTEVNIVADISIAHAAQPTTDQGLLVMLGGGGALIEAQYYPLACLLRLRFRLPPGEGEEIRCQGVVCSEVAGRGVGVEFLNISAPDRDRIMAFVERYIT